MTKKFPAIILGLFIVISINSCDTKVNSGVPRSIGNTSEILVIVDSEKQWDNGIGSIIRETLGQDQYGLNQAEPMFKLSHVQKKSFSDLFKKHHNLFIVGVNPAVKEPKIEANVDLWSKPQQIYKLTAGSDKELIELINNNKNLFINAYQKTDRDRIMEVFRPIQNNEAVSKILKNTGIKIVVPKDFYLAKESKDFCWVRKEAAEFSQGYFIMSSDYLDTAQFSKESIMSRINLALKTNVPGSVHNSYMSTDNEFMPPEKTVLDDFLGGYAAKIVGTWVVENDFMGGPFVSYTFYNEANSKIVTLMGYVYKPNKDKRDLLKQVEALLYSAKVETKK